MGVVDVNTVYVGGANGLFRFERSTGGSWCASAGQCGQLNAFAGMEVRSLVLRPDRTVLWAAFDTTNGTYGSGLYRLTNLTGTGAVTTAGPATGGLANGTIRSLSVATNGMSNPVFVADGTAGVFECNAVGSSVSCAAFNGSGTSKLNPADDWTAVAAVQPSAGSFTVYAGCTEDHDSSGVAASPSTCSASGDGSIWQTTGTSTSGSWSSSSSYNLCVPPSSLSSCVTWWMTQMAYYLDGSDMTISQLSIDPNNPSRVFAVGRVGIWRTTNGGTTWSPAVQGLSTLVARDVAADTHGNALVADTDFSAIAGGSDLAEGNAPWQPGSSKTGYATTTYGGRAYIGTGSRNTSGPVSAQSGIFSCNLTTGQADSCVGGAWVREFEPTDYPGTGSSGQFHRIIGVAVGTDTGSLPTTHLVVATDGDGVWDKDSNCTLSGTSTCWRQVSSTLAESGASPLNYRYDMYFATDTTGTYVYLFDPLYKVSPGPGVYRSSNLNNNETTWDFTVGSGFQSWTAMNIKNAANTNYLAGFGTGSSTVLYTSAADTSTMLIAKYGVWQVTTPAGTPATSQYLSQTWTGRSGAIAIEPDNGKVVVAQNADSNGNVRLFKAKSTAACTTSPCFNEVQTISWTSQALFVDGMTIGQDSSSGYYLYATDKGGGVIAGSEP